MPLENENIQAQSSKSAKQRNTGGSEQDYKTPRTAFFSTTNQLNFSRTASPESPPLEISPVQELFVDDIEIPSSKNLFLSTPNSKDITKELTVVRKRQIGTEQKKSHASTSFVDRYCSSPEEEVESVSEEESETFKFLKDDEVSTSSEKSLKFPSGLKNLFADAGTDSPKRSTLKNRNPCGLAVDTDLFSPRLSSDALDESGRKSRLSRNELSEPKAMKTSSDSSTQSSLRRPIGSRRRTLINLSRLSQSEELSPRSTSRSKEEYNISNVKAEEKPKTSPGGSNSTETSCEQVKVISPLMTKGVIMRAQTHKTNVNGIRKAETGKIMSREELLGDRKTVFLRESPIPKSLNPAAFSEEDDVMTRRPSTLFQYSSSESDRGVPNSSIQKEENDDGTFLTDKASLGYIYQEVQSSSSSKFSENGSSSGLVNRLGSSFKKAKNVVARRSATDIPELNNTDMLIVGTIDEVVCKVCYVCRKKMGCRVFVKNTGKKIKVEADDREIGYYVRASLFVRTLGGEEPSCAINIRQSRADGMKTNFASLWDFYQRLEKGLSELETGNNR
ncbi:unnamed protein product [Agarophyton chilense]